jgi:hypothetical protein
MLPMIFPSSVFWEKMCRLAMSPGNVPVAIGADRRSRELLKSLAVNGIFGVGGGFSGIFIFVIDALYKQPDRAQQPSQDNNTTRVIFFIRHDRQE